MIAMNLEQAAVNEDLSHGFHHLRPLLLHLWQHMGISPLAWLLVLNRPFGLPYLLLLPVATTIHAVMYQTQKGFQLPLHLGQRSVLGGLLHHPRSTPMTLSNPAIPVIDPSPAPALAALSTSTTPAPPLPVLSDDEAGADSGMDNATGEPLGPPSITTPHSTTTTPPGPTLGHGSRGWAAIDDQESQAFRCTQDEHDWPMALATQRRSAA